MSGLTPEVAFYYPGPVWRSEKHIKNLLLYFDGIGLVVPTYILTKPEELFPHLATPLREAGLLHLLEPEKLVDAAATAKLATALADIITSGALDPLADDGMPFHELSYSRLGYNGDAGLAEMIHDELVRRNLASKSKDGLSVPMHPFVRNLVLVLLAQILRSKGQQLGYELSPTTDRPEVLQAFTHLLNLPSLPSSGSVVSLDLQAVGVDVGNAPLDEILDFRREHHAKYRRYMRAVRGYVDHVSLLAPPQRHHAQLARAGEIRDLADDVARLKGHWKGKAAVGIGIAGAVWTAAQHDPLGALLMGAAAVLGTQPKPEVSGAFSYLIEARGRYG